jgi:hypothetical protein
MRAVADSVRLAQPTGRDLLDHFAEDVLGQCGDHPR